MLALLTTGLDPVGFLLHLLTAALTHFVDTARSDVTTVLQQYLLSTTDVSSPQHGPLTGRDTLRRMNLGMAVAMDLLIAAVLTYAALRSMFERSLRSHYSLKVLLPRLLSAIVMIHFSLPLMQMVIDLNNALGSVAMTLGEQFHAGDFPWAAPLGAPAVAEISASQNLFRAVFAVGLVIALVILMLAYVVRYALLAVLIVTAPMAALCAVLPDTVEHARSWLRLFLATVFMQAVQLIVLRVAAVTALDQSTSLVQTIYALATLWLMLKVPGALNTASHFDTKAKTEAHAIGKSLHKALFPAAHASHHA